jgi:predicted ATP-binding protein involved in virulence
MRFESIEVQNMRLFGDDKCIVTADVDKNVIILLGDNGTGKTSLLDAIAISIAPFVAQFPQNSDRAFTDFDVHVTERGRQASYLSVQASFRLPSGTVIASRRTRKGLEKGPDSDVRQLKAYAAGLKDAILAERPDVTLPILAYFGTGRGQIKAPERKRSFQKTFERWDCYHSALTPAADFKTFFQWFDLMEDEERRHREQIRDFDYKSPVLTAVRRAVADFMPERFTNPHIEIHPLRFVVDECDSHTRRQLRIEQLSDGYKIVLAMVADIAARMAEANPDRADILSTPGLVLIDEVDLHLHPLWQRTIIRQLVRTFPNVQFVVSTHSPIIVVGASDIAQVVHLGKDVPQADLWNMNVSQVLLSDLFNLRSLFGPQWDTDMQRRDALLSQPTLTEVEQRELTALEEKLAAVSFCDNRHLLRSTQLVDKIAQQLGIRL